jgi:YVTN family beta-propeller protein
LDTKSTASEASRPTFSPDAAWWWDGNVWQPTISPDGIWRWDGAAWVSRQAATPTPSSSTWPARRLLRWMSVGGAAVLHIALLLFAAAFLFYIYTNGDYPSTALFLVGAVLVTLWLGAIGIGWRTWRRHAILIWLLPIVWFASYFPALQVGCANCDWGQGAIVRQGTSAGHSYVAIRVQANAQTVTIVNDEVWLPDLDGSAIWTYAGERGHPSGLVSTAKSPFQVVSDGSALWVSSAGGSISKFDATSRREVHREQVGGEPLFLSVNGASVWVTDNQNDRVFQLDRQSGQLSKTIVTGREPGGIVALDDAIWVTEYGADEVIRIDPITGRVVAHIPTGVGPGNVAFAFGSVWVTNENGDQMLVRIDPGTNKAISRIRVGATPLGIAQVGSELWVANVDSKTISVIDPTTNSVTATIRLPGNPYTLASGAAGVWVTTYRQRQLLRIDLIR